MENGIDVEWLSENLIYDENTGLICWAKRGFGRQVGKEAGCIDAHGYRRIMVKSKPYGGHVIAWALHHKELPSGYIDHINGVRDDNRACNLRVATASQNIANSKTSKRNTSGFKGVCWNKVCGKWQAGIRVLGKSLHLGLYSDPVEAHKAYLAAAKHYFGEFSRAN